ncbi:MAG: deoxyribodipyrimidine photo-lyase [Deltaproteobacteria bacterium]|nr:deoxyribodipyrimidine photo-lyase [Deltaproteobacteria bacterium]MDH3851395.1 deoxyribodipyrimidine photo-lyase [Deltaproteobacteria bacterium]
MNKVVPFTGNSVMVDPRRVRIVKQGSIGSGSVLYWMSRDQRVNDNWALLFAQELALERKVSLGVVFSLVPRFLNATSRQYGFMLKGLQEVENHLAELNIPFFLLIGSPEQELPAFLVKHHIGGLVTDFDPLRIKQQWKKEVAAHIKSRIYEVDGRNIVPCWEASSKKEYAAYTLRPKIHRALPEFLKDFPLAQKHPFPWPKKVKKTNWDEAEISLKIDRSVPEIDWLLPGEKAAAATLDRFLTKKLSAYASRRNDPTEDGVSNLSPYLHFGQISAQRVALQLKKKKVNKESKDGFLEELIVRRELSDNFCFYNPDYDRFAGFPEWAQKTLNEHRGDKREYLYSLEQFEDGKTHDDLWNAAQMEMVHRGKMHGYLRMYWAKKILEWTGSPEEALEVAILLNDKYELDGRDTNGYVGIAWSVGGVHDRAWKERPIFGKIRYMSYGGCKAKFDVNSYIKHNLS